MEGEEFGSRPDEERKGRKTPQLTKHGKREGKKTSDVIFGRGRLGAE